MNAPVTFIKKSPQAIYTACGDLARPKGLEPLTF